MQVPNAPHNAVTRKPLSILKHINHECSLWQNQQLKEMYSFSDFVHMKSHVISYILMYAFMMNVCPNLCSHKSEMIFADVDVIQFIMTEKLSNYYYSTVFHLYVINVTQLWWTKKYWHTFLTNLVQWTV